PIITLPEIPPLPNTTMVIRTDKKTAQEMEDILENETKAIHLTPVIKTETTEPSKSDNNEKEMNQDITNDESLNETDTLEEDIIQYYTIGTIITIDKIEQINDLCQLSISIEDKIETEEIQERNNKPYATYKIISENNQIESEDQKEIVTTLKDITKEITQNFPQAQQYTAKLNTITTIHPLLEAVLPYIKITRKQNQNLLESENDHIRALKTINILLDQKETIKLQLDLARKLNQEMEKTHKINLLKEQSKLIQEEINNAQGNPTKETYRSKIEKLDLPEEVEKAALEEVQKLETQGQNNQEENIIRNYLDTIIKLPWKKETPQSIDINKARETLDKHHYGLEKVKERIIEHLAVMKIKENKQGSILLLAGPPGTGKTSIGKSIAEALDRPYVRTSLGGVTDEAELLGHRRTYLGALPGRIINNMKKAGKTNPIFVLDEIDKLTTTHKGNPTSTLLEILDPEQNNSFSDHYLELPYDLSDIFFIATANTLENIPLPLRDRLEIINIESYTTNEKELIAEKHLITEVLEEHGLKKDQLIIEHDAITEIIEKYTREAGVRELKQQLSKITRKIIEKIVDNKIETPYTVTKDMLHDLLGNPKAHYEIVKEKNLPGVVTGLAWTPLGGDILYIEAVQIPGKGKLKLTGQLGDVMKESAQIAWSLVKSRLTLQLKNTNYEEQDIHIHVPEGAIPKDGPSAGVTMLTTIASIVTGQPVDSKLAMTGEISLRGQILPVGGIKEKIIAAHRSGIKRVILPIENKKDLEDVPENIQEELEFIFVDTIEELLEKTLNIEVPRSTQVETPITQINSQIE
ncbi:MAG: endopeptidase La, partial [Methanobacteriaceae archaeon]|nr:endopeptidase La [Methanobacteriaceae archaeon]